VIFVVLPAYNEAEALPRLLRRIASISRAHFGHSLRKQKKNQKNQKKKIQK
jgi:hypothetical protein